MFEIASKALNTPCTAWRGIIIGISIDGEGQITGRVSRVAARFQQAAKPGFIRICCGAYQLDIVMQKIYTGFSDDDFYAKLTAVISYLRRQQNFIGELWSKAPKVADTRWEWMSGGSSCFKFLNIAVDEHLERKKPSCKPPPRWSAEIMIIDHFAVRSTLTFKQLQGHAVTVSMQKSRLASLQDFHLSAFDDMGPLLESEANALDLEQCMLSTCRRFAGSYAKAKTPISYHESRLLRASEGSATSMR